MDDIKRLYQGNRDKLSEHAKIEELMYNWEILGTSYELIDLVGRGLPDSIKHKGTHTGIDAKITKSLNLTLWTCCKVSQEKRSCTSKNL